MARVSIVFTDGPDSGFEVQMEGIDYATLEKIAPEKWPASAFYGMHCFRIIGDVLKQIGALNTTSSVRQEAKH